MNKATRASLLVTLGALIAATVVAIIATTVTLAAEMTDDTLVQVQTCQRADGSGDTQTYPCKWDNGTVDRTRPPVTLYVRGTDAPCPAGLPYTVECIDVDSWTQLPTSTRLPTCPTADRNPIQAHGSVCYWPGTDETRPHVSIATDADPSHNLIVWTLY